jgi:hypothetical protein
MSTSITVSERAARRIGEILKGEPSGTMLRVSVEGGGCSGFQYKFDMERAKATDDLVINRDGAVVLTCTMTGVVSGKASMSRWRTDSPPATAAARAATYDRRTSHHPSDGHLRAEWWHHQGVAVLQFLGIGRNSVKE